MALKIEKIESFSSDHKSGVRKKMKNQRNRKIRRVPKDEVPNIKQRLGILK